MIHTIANQHILNAKNWGLAHNICCDKDWKVCTCLPEVYPEQTYDLPADIAYAENTECVDCVFYRQPSCLPLRKLVKQICLKPVPKESIVKIVPCEQFELRDMDEPVNLSAYGQYSYYPPRPGEQKSQRNI